MGAEVMVVEFLDRILPGTDTDIARQFQRMLAKQGIGFRLGSKVTGVEKFKSGLKVSVDPAKGGEAEVLDADVVLVSIGRIADTVRTRHPCLLCRKVP